jgi:hypothetical protein
LTDQGKNGEIHRADPAWRRRMQVLLALCVVGCAGALFALWHWLSGLAAAGAGDSAGGFDRPLAQALGAVCIGLGLASAGFALWMFRLASATHAEKRWPPSSMRTSADMRIRYLSSADRLVTQMKAGALGLALLGAGLLGWGAWLLLHA